MKSTRMLSIQGPAIASANIPLCLNHCSNRMLVGTAALTDYADRLELRTALNSLDTASDNLCYKCRRVGC